MKKAAKHELVSVREYARRRKCSHQAILKAITAGKIVSHAGKIDPAEADLALDQGAATYSEALTRKTQAQASREELKLALAQGEVVPIQTVRRAQEAINSVIRSKLLALPQKMAPQFAGRTMTGPQIAEILRLEVYECLDELAAKAR